MGSLNQFLKVIKSFDFESACVRSMKENENKIIEFNKELLIQGKQADGVDIRPEYASMSYAKVKQKMNSRPKYGTPDLKLSGKFHNSLYLSGANVKSKDDKASALARRYGSEILGLNVKFVGEIRKLIFPVIRKKFKAYAMRMQ